MQNRNVFCACAVAAETRAGTQIIIPAAKKMAVSIFPNFFTVLSPCRIRAFYAHSRKYRNASMPMTIR